VTAEGLDQSAAQPDAVERLRRKLARDATTRARDRYFCLAILPALMGWAMLVAAVSAVAGALVPLGVALTVYFSGAAVLVIWLERRAKNQVATS
jgi:hypothetical protein